jgi:hypothetical protein
MTFLVNKNIHKKDWKGIKSQNEKDIPWPFTNGVGGAGFMGAGNLYRPGQ